MCLYGTKVTSKLWPYWCDTYEKMRSIEIVGLTKGQAANVHNRSSHWRQYGRKDKIGQYVSSESNKRILHEKNILWYYNVEAACFR